LPPLCTPSPYTTLFRSGCRGALSQMPGPSAGEPAGEGAIGRSPGLSRSEGRAAGTTGDPEPAGRRIVRVCAPSGMLAGALFVARSEEHTSELQSPDHLV